MLDPGREIHLFRALKKAGYALGYIGKNHLLDRTEFENFDYTDVWRIDHEEGEQEKALNDWLRGHGEKMRGEGVFAKGTYHDFPPEATRPHVKATSAIKFLDERPKDKPFCLTLSFSDPHVPHLAMRKFEELYPPERMKLHPTREGELDEKASRFNVKVQCLRAPEATEEQRRHYMAIYYSMISWVDEQVGRVLEKLRAEGLDENTVVVFTSDHGEFCFDHGMYKKDLVLLDALLHVPLFISWPGHLEPAEVKDTFVEEVDVMPTLLDLLGVQPPYGVQGRSFAPCLRGESRQHRAEVHAEICPPWLHNPYGTFDSFCDYWQDKFGGRPGINVPGDFTKSIRDENYRYIWYHSGEEELYDVREDPHEWFNLADDPDHAEAKREMKLRLLEWNALTEDPLDPLLVRGLLTEYDGWSGSEPSPGRTAGPYWMEYRFNAPNRIP
jgi:arylsulfatase A-like enzyme